MVRYAEDLYDKIESKTAPVKRRPYKVHGVTCATLAPGQEASGYGRKIATDYMVRFDNGPWRRVYCYCFSNSGTLYALVNKEWVCFHQDENLKLNGEWLLQEYWEWHAKFQGCTVEEYKKMKRADVLTP